MFCFSQYFLDDHVSWIGYAGERVMLFTFFFLWSISILDVGNQPGCVDSVGCCTELLCGALEAQVLRFSNQEVLLQPTLLLPGIFPVDCSSWYLL